MMRDIYLYGPLADQFGPRHRFNVASPAEAMWALDTNYGGFFKAIKKDGLYQIVRGPDLEADQLGADQLTMRFGEGAFHFCPIIEGSGGGSGKGIATAVIGVALLATGVGGALYAGSFGAYALGSATSMMSLTWGTIALAGAALTFSGVSQMLTQTPKVDTYDIRDKDSKNRKSHLFNGPVNTIEQGTCIPVVFGRHWVGSTVISAGMTIIDEDV